MGLIEYLLDLKSEDFFYGRTEERAKLKEFLDENRSLIVVRGEPAIGKSTLVSKVLSDYSTNRIIDVAIEKGDSMCPYRVFAEILKEILGNPKNDEEINKNLDRFYFGNETESVKIDKEIIKSFIWGYYQFNNYDRVSFASEEIDRLVSSSLINFFSSYKDHLIIRIQNYERRLLGENKKTDELIGKITDKSNRTSFIIETRDDLKLGEEIFLGPLEEFPLKEYFKAKGIELNGQTDKIRKLSKNHTYVMELWPFFFQDYDFKDKKFMCLEDFIDIAIKNMNEKSHIQTNILNIFSLSQKSITIEKIAELTNILNLNEEDVKWSCSELLEKKLIHSTLYQGKKSFSVKNPRLGERVVELMDDKKKIDLHRILYKVSDYDRDKFWHSIGGRMPVEAFETFIILDKYSAPADNIEVCNKTIELIDGFDLDEIVGEESLRSRMIKLVFRKALRELSLGNYELTNSVNKIRLNIPNLPDDPDFDWFKTYLDFTTRKGLGDFKNAQNCLDELEKIAERINNEKIFNKKKSFLRFDPLLIVAYNKDYFAYERSLLDNSLDNKEKKRILEDARKKRDVIKDISNLEESVLAGVLRQLSKYSEETGLLEMAEKHVLNALNNTSESEMDTKLVISFTAAEIYLDKGEYEKARLMLDESDKIAKSYGRSRRDTVENYLARISLAKKDGDVLLEKEFSKKAINLLANSQPKNFFGYKRLVEELTETINN